MALMENESNIDSFCVYLQDSERNLGEIEILPLDFINRNNWDKLDITVGIIQINLTNPMQALDLEQTP